MPISMLKYIKIHKNTPTCFDLNRSLSGSMYLVKVTELCKKHWIWNPEDHSRCCGSKTCSRYTWWPVWCCASNARLLRLWVRIPPGEWVFVCCECCVLSGRGLCDGLITRPEESYRLWRVVCDQETS